MSTVATVPTETRWVSRAVIRPIEAGNYAECPHCLERMTFRARHREQQVICNIYEHEVWQRVEHYHPVCYDEADQPYGAPLPG